MVWGYVASAFIGVLGGGEDRIDLKTLLALLITLAIVFIAVNLYLNFTNQTILEALGLENLGENVGEFIGNNLIRNNPISFLFSVGTGIGSAIFQRR